MVDMKRTPKEKQETAEMATPIASNQPDYPYGLSISLCEDELEKLGFVQNELQVGDMVHLNAMASVTSVSSSDNHVNGPSCRVELQLTHIQAEDEDEEFEESEPVSSGNKISKLYSR